MIELNDEAKKECTVQYKLAPLPTASKFWVLHVQVGKDGSKQDGDYLSDSIVVPHTVAIEFQKSEVGETLGFYPSFRSGSMQGYIRRCTSEGASFYGGVQFLNEFSFSFRQYIEALRAAKGGSSLDSFQVFSKDAEKEIAVQLEAKILNESLKSLMNTDSDTAH